MLVTLVFPREWLAVAIIAWITLTTLASIKRTPKLVLQGMHSVDMALAVEFPAEGDRAAWVPSALKVSTNPGSSWTSSPLFGLPLA